MIMEKFETLGKLFNEMEKFFFEKCDEELFKYKHDEDTTRNISIDECNCCIKMLLNDDNKLAIIVIYKGKQYSNLVDKKDKQYYSHLNKKVQDKLIKNKEFFLVGLDFLIDDFRIKEEEKYLDENGNFHFTMCDKKYYY